mgnify:FL=1
MFRINKITRGRFGNKILQYNNLVQLNSLFSAEPSCDRWAGHDFFVDLAGYKRASNPEKELGWLALLDADLSMFSSDTEYVIDSYCLHNAFWKVTQQDPRTFLRIRPEFKKSLPDDSINIGIHLRGTDILGADGNHGREIHFPKYYKDSIDIIEAEFENTKYYVCTDDINFISYTETIKHLEERGCSYETGDVHNHFTDFATLSECDVLVASSSTFVVCAGFLGKDNKKIIHSQDWIQKNLNHEPWHQKPDPESVRKMQISFDNFWNVLYNGGNKFYKVWRWI